MRIIEIHKMNLAAPRPQHNLTGANFRHGPEFIDFVNVRFAVRLRPNFPGSRAGMGAVLGRAKNHAIAGTPRSFAFG